jgi:leucyl aminopeptidase
LLLHTQKVVLAEKLILVGLGKKEKFTLDKLRQALARSARKARSLKLSSVASPLFHVDGLDFDVKDTARTTIEGIKLGLYRYIKYKTKKEDKEDKDPKNWTICLPEGVKKSVVHQKIVEGEVLSESVSFARDLVNAPGNDVTPARLVWEAKSIAKQYKMKSVVLDQARMKKEGMGAILSVARGSEEKPAFIILEYWGTKKSVKPIALVGKAVTFDSGGISLKPSLHMEEMKMDMSGGAATLGAMKVLGELKPPINVIAAIPATENLPSGKATKPGDVIKSFSGQTVEVINTDAEGRLILADALSYVNKTYKPRSIIDMATLTGACIVALGTVVTGMMGNNKELLDKLRKAGEKTWERVWELPLWEDYDDSIKSDVADMKNVGNRTAGTIVGGIFLKRFVGDTPWVHLDIAGTAWSEKDSTYQTKGGTGVGIRLLWEYLQGECK